MFILHVRAPFTSSFTSFTLFRLARGSILASIIRIMSSGPLRVGALSVSGLFAVFYVVTLTQYIWVCEANIIPGYVPFLESPFASCSPCYERPHSELQAV